MERMKVIEPDGSVGNREIDYVERYDGAAQLVRPRAVPVLNDGEDILWIMGESMPRIVSTDGRNTAYAYTYTQ